MQSMLVSLTQIGRLILGASHPCMAPEQQYNIMVNDIKSNIKV
jgi:hypothetical protein